MMSPASSGGVWSRVARTASTMACSGSSSAWRTSALETTTVRGQAAPGRGRGSRPRARRAAGRPSRGRTLTSSAVRSPSMREYSFFIARDDGLVEVVAGGADGQAGDDAAQRDDRDLGGPAADVDDHVAGGLVHGEPGADRGGHRLLDDVDPAGTGLVARLLHGALLDGGDAAGHADHHAGLGEVAAPVDLLDEEAQHLLGRLEVGDHAVLERPDGGDVVGRAADHPLGLVAHGEDLARGGVQRDDAGLVEQDSLAADVDEGVGGAEVHGHVPADEAVRHCAAALEEDGAAGKGVTQG